jgi:hypothetical protein
MARISTAIVTILFLAPDSTLRADDLKEIRNLIPAAAAMTLGDMDKLATSTTPPKPSDVESKTLTLMLFSLKGGDDEKAKKEFRYLTERIPKPSQLAMEINRFVKGRGKIRFALGPVTMIHADRITDVTCKVDGDMATGTVSFKVPSLYEGKADYVARRKAGKWQITEFKLPANKVHIVRDDKGVWRKK